MMAGRQRVLLALRRELLIARADFQREALRAQLQASLKPGKTLQALLSIWRKMPVPAPLLAAVAPALVFFFARRLSLFRLTKWALPMWMATRGARTAMRRPRT